MEQQSYSTSDAILAITLFLAGCEPVEERMPVTNLFDKEIIFKLGGGVRHEQTGAVIRASRFAGMKDEDAAKILWEEKAKGHVQFHLKLTERTQFLIQAHQDQMEKIEKGEGKAFDMLHSILKDFNAGAMAVDEAILRVACVNLKTRGEFVNLWKQMVPLLRVPVEGKTKHFDATTIQHGITVAAKGVQRPGCKVMSLNLSDQHKKDMKL